MPPVELGPVELGSSLAKVVELGDETKNSLAEGLVDAYLEYLRVTLAGTPISRQESMEVFYKGMQILNKRSLQGAL